MVFMYRVVRIDSFKLEVIRSFTGRAAPAHWTLNHGLQVRRRQPCRLGGLTLKFGMQSLNRFAGTSPEFIGSFNLFDYEVIVDFMACNELSHLVE